jgi:hypothetical protein
MFVTKLSDESKQILHLILRRGVVSGADLLSATAMTPAVLVQALDPLLKSEIVGSSGNAYDQSGIRDAFFNVRPSARSLAEGYLNL